MSHKQAKAQRQKLEWYKMKSFFDGSAKKIAEMQGEDVVLSGWVEPHRDLAVVLVPTSVTQEQGRVLEMTLKAQFGHSVLVLTNNVQLVRLQRCSEDEARRIMEAAEADVIHYSKEQEDDGGQERTEGGGVREQGGERSEGDLRPAGADGGDSGAAEEGPGGDVSDPQGAEEEPGKAQ